MKLELKCVVLALMLVVFSRADGRADDWPQWMGPQRPEVTIAMPRLAGTHLFLSSFYQGSLLLDLAVPEPALVWNRRSKRKSEFDDGLHTTMCTPVIRDGQIYGVCGYGELRCLDLATGDRKWETFQPTEGKKSLFGQVFIVEQAGRYWMWNDQGELQQFSFWPRLGPLSETLS